MRNKKSINARSWSTATDSPGASTVKAPSSAAVLGTYLSFMPVNEGVAPDPVEMANVSVGSLFKGPRGSFKILRVSSPVLVRVVVSLRFSTELTVEGPNTHISTVFGKYFRANIPVTFRERDCDAETRATSEAREMSVPRRDWENMLGGDFNESAQYKSTCIYTQTNAAKGAWTNIGSLKNQRDTQGMIRVQRDS